MKLETVKFMLWAADMDRGVAFYRDVFGLEPKLVTPHWSELAAGDAIVALHGGGTGELNLTGLSLQVDDAEEAVRRAVAAGATVRRPLEDRPRETIRLADLVDPEGNGFSVTARLG
jgi:predicted enzyme related to lactoylglutathione lyase